MTGPLADALNRDLIADRLTLDELGWRGLWSYVTAAPPNTAIHYTVTEGWSLGDKIAALQLHAEQWLHWRYAAIHFVGAKDLPTPDYIPFPGLGQTEEEQISHSWETATIHDLMTPEVRALMQEGA